MFLAILLTLLAIIMTYPGLPFVFTISAIAAYAQRGCLGVIVGFFVFVCYCMAVSFAWAEAIGRWLAL